MSSGINAQLMRPAWRGSTDRPLKLNAVVRAVTRKLDSFDRLLIRLSVEAVAQIFRLGIGAPIREGQDGDGMDFRLPDLCGE